MANLRAKVAARSARSTSSSPPALCSSIRASLNAALGLGGSLVLFVVPQAATGADNDDCTTDDDRVEGEERVLSRVERRVRAVEAWAIFSGALTMVRDVLRSIPPSSPTLPVALTLPATGA